MASDPPPPRRAPPFTPSGTLMLIYFGVFFVGFALLVVLPDLLAELSKLPPDADAKEAGREAARQAVTRPKLAVAFVLALGLAALGAWRGWLPGAKPRR